MPQDKPQTDVLFISEQSLWPPDQGFRVHGCQMARALVDQGLTVRMASLRPTTQNCDIWLKNMLVDWPEADDSDHELFMQSWKGWFTGMRKRLARHQALDTRELAGLIPLVKQYNPKAIIALGQHGPIMLQGLEALRPELPEMKTVWYAADEPVNFQLSCLRREGIFSLKHRLYLAALYAMLQRLFARKLDVVIGVSPTDTRLLKRMTCAKQAINIPNGVDTAFYKPSDTPFAPCTLVFWGRLDFEPNIDAVRWFAKKVFPKLIDRQPQTRWQIVGKNACEKVRQLGKHPQIQFVGEVDDIRPYAHTAAATILPMRCGAGIKNKLLEAAAMGLPIIASPRAVQGLSWPEHMKPLFVCRTPDEWVHQIERTWYDGLLNRQLREDAHEWIVQHHSWSEAAHKLDACLQLSSIEVTDDVTHHIAGGIPHVPLDAKQSA